MAKWQSTHNNKTTEVNNIDYLIRTAHDYLVCQSWCVERRKNGQANKDLSNFNRMMITMGQSISKMPGRYGYSSYALVGTYQKLSKEGQMVNQ